MKVLIQSCVFGPSIGGTETATRLLAIGLQELGHEVKIMTDTEGDSPYTLSLDVYRRPTASTMLRLTRWCEVYVQSNISLRNVWPLLIFRRPWMIIHHTRIEAGAGAPTFSSRLKQKFTRLATNLTVSHYMAENLESPSVIVKNPYADDVFHLQSDVPRDRELIVVGRMNEDKGFQVAIHALHRLHKRGHTGIRMTLVGEGPHLDTLRALAQKRELTSAIEFTGLKQPEDLAETLNRHRILIVPSLTSETFGLVAVEGMACGCLVIGSNVGGLKETIGPCGVTFPSGNADALANLIQDLLADPARIESYLKPASSHLAQFVRGAIIPSYADCIRQALERWRGKS